MLCPGTSSWAIQLQSCLCVRTSRSVGKVHHLGVVPSACRQVTISWLSREDRDRGLMRTLTNQISTHWKFQVQSWEACQDKSIPVGDTSRALWTTYVRSSGTSSYLFHFSVTNKTEDAPETKKWPLYWVSMWPIHMLSILLHLNLIMLPSGYYHYLIH